MNYLWAGMMLIGILYAAFTGRLPEVTDAALNSAKEAISLCITMTGAMAFWVGIMKIAENGGVVEGLGKKLNPILSFLFPNLRNDAPARKHIAVNFMANMLGLGWAATPAGLLAMKELQKENGSKHIATPEMCNFLIINISSLQLIPINIITYRSQYGSVNPTEIVGPALLATLGSTLAGFLFCGIMNQREKRRRAGH